MADYEPFATQTDYTVPLLHLLSELPGGQGKAAEVCRLFEEKYVRLIPEEDRGLRSSNGALIWKNNIRWSRNNLKNYGLLDAPAYGIWRITDAGRQWLKENPNATRIKGKARRSSGSRRKRSKKKIVSGLTLEMLEQTRKVGQSHLLRQAG